MVSNARLDLPDPDKPVITTSLSRGISREMFLRLCTRAPCTAMVVRAAGGEGLGFFMGATAWTASLSRPRSGGADIDERQLLHLDVALLRQADGRGDPAAPPPICKVLAGGRHSRHAVFACEVRFNLARGTHVPHLGQIIEHRREEYRRTLRDVRIDGIQRGLTPSTSLFFAG